MRAVLTVTLLLTTASPAVFADLDDQYEPNDTCYEAVSGALDMSGYPIQCYLATDNEDWFELFVHEGAALIVQTNAGDIEPFAGDTIIEAFNDCGDPSPIAHGDDIDAAGGNYYSAVYLNVPGPGTYYVRVIQGQHGQSGGWYELECYLGTVGAVDCSWGRIKALFK